MTMSTYYLKAWCPKCKEVTEQVREAHSNRLIGTISVEFSCKKCKTMISVGDKGLPKYLYIRDLGWGCNKCKDCETQFAEGVDGKCPSCGSGNLCYSQWKLEEDSPTKKVTPSHD